jgi:hypothetical protein
MAIEHRWRDPHAAAVPGPLPAGRLTPGWLRTRVGLGAATALVTLLALACRGFDLDHVNHVDSPLWFFRTYTFWNALGEGDWGQTRLAPHPGVTLMWTMGAALRLFGIGGNGLHPDGLIVAKLPSVLVGVAAATLTLPLLGRLLRRDGLLVALVCAVLIATEPQLIRSSRMVHLDMLATGLAWIGVLCTLGIAAAPRRLALAAGLLFGAAVMARLSVAPLVAGAGLVLCFDCLRRPPEGVQPWEPPAIVAGTATLTCFMMWPALLADPIGLVTSVVEETQRVVGRGHLGIERGPEYYLFWALRTLPHETLIGALLGLPWLVMGADRDALRRLFFVHLPFAVVILLSAKKLSRYLIPALPLVTALAAYGAVRLLDVSLRRVPARAAVTVALATVVLLGAGRSLRIAHAHPLVSTCSSWPGRACGPRPAQYYPRTLGLALRDHMPERGRPRVYVSNGALCRLMKPWFGCKKIRDPKSVHFIVLRGNDFDRNGERLRRKAGRKLGSFIMAAEPIVDVLDRGVLRERAYLGPRHRDYRPPPPDQGRRPRAPPAGQAPVVIRIEQPSTD